jgi:geranylgeranyl pyrophosphate synthase
MTEKVVMLKPRTLLTQSKTDSTWHKVVDFIQPQFSGVELNLEQAVLKAPEIIRGYSLESLYNGERYCPALFLTVSKHCQLESEIITRYAASLEALDLALRVHRMIKQNPSCDKSSAHTTALLSGDFYFSLALNLAADAPSFIQGMAEIISRVVSSELERPVQRGGNTGWRNQYLRKLSGGYASIMALSAILAGWCSGMDTRRNKLLAFFGHYVGMGLRLRREQVMFKLNRRVKVSAGDLTLPIIYVLEYSARGPELLSQVNRPGGLSLMDDLFMQEYERIKPDVYIEQISGKFISKAQECLDVLRDSLPADTGAALSNFTLIHELV